MNLGTSHPVARFPMGMPPRLGEHTAALLAQAGWSAERIAGLQITQQET